MLDGERWAMVAEKAHSVKAYNDPSLHVHQHYIRFLKHLHQSGVLGLYLTVVVGLGLSRIIKPKFIDGKRIDRLFCIVLPSTMPSKILP